VDDREEGEGETKVQYITFSSMVRYQHQERENKRSGFYHLWMHLIIIYNQNTCLYGGGGMFEFHPLY